MSSHRSSLGASDHDGTLSLAACRRALGRTAVGISDERLQTLRAELYDLASAVVTAFQDLHSADENRLLASLSAADREWVEERAAVFEFEGRMTREAATLQALLAYWERRSGAA